MTFDDPSLRQRGRASIDFLGQLLMARAPVRKQIAIDLAQAGVSADTLPDDIDAGVAAYEGALAGSDAFHAMELIADWHYRRYGAIVTDAFEEIEPALAGEIAALETGTASLTLDPDFKPPAYWKGVDFHRTEGGWDGHAHMGYIHGELIHKKLVNVLSDTGIFKQRGVAAARAPKDQYARILDMGCSSGHYTTMLAQTYPQAKITGVELSARMLEHAHRTANLKGYDWDLYQCAAEDTPFADASFDLVTSYILLHEMPASAIEAMFVEAFRLLEPGGDMVMSDVPRYADMDRLAIVKADRDARDGGEPHWRSAAKLDVAALARSIGFDAVTTTEAYPYSVIATKPQ
ncbi:MAG: class I SAM-dependent methyltransferase [Pseudomonadota bacterium]